MTSTLVVARRTPLPNGRAVLGGLLVAISVVGIFAAYRSATTVAAREYVVAERDLVAGTVLTAGDLTTRAIDLPPDLAARAATEPAVLVGDVTVAPLADGDLVQASSVADAGSAPNMPELSFAIARDRAVNGLLTPGERVDVIATYGSGDSAWTELVVAGATVVSIADGGAGPIVVDRETVLTLALPNGADVLAVAHAVRAGDITVLRTTAGGDATGGATVYWPRRPADRDDSPG